MHRTLSPTQPKEKRLKNFNEVALGFSKKTAVQEARLFPQGVSEERRPKCPLGIDILSFVRLLREGDIQGAEKKIREANDLPAVCGRVCLAPCEQEFVVAGKKFPVNVRALERFAADHGREKSLLKKRAQPNGKKIAIIGSGPAGLVAASRLAQNNFQVTIFESLPLPGGVLRYGIPGFRLPQHIVEAEVEHLKLLGVQIKTNCHVGQAVTVKEIFAQGFEFLILAVGRPQPVLGKIKNEHLPGVYYTQEILLKENFSGKTLRDKTADGRLGQKVIVVGETSCALDCARLCARLGSEVSLVFEGVEEELDVHPDEKLYAFEEGIKYEALSAALEVQSTSEGLVRGLKCIRMDFADPQHSGKWQLMPVPDSEFMLEADTVILSSRHKATALVSKIVPELKCNRDATLWTNDKGETSVPNIFAAGDMVLGRSHVVDAMVSGKTVAQTIIQRVNGL